MIGGPQLDAKTIEIFDQPLSFSNNSKHLRIYCNRFVQLIKYSIMSSNVGLSTPRGSGTSGYVQRNLSHLRPRDTIAPYPKDYDSIKHRQRQPDKAILAHDRAREIEVQVFDLRDKLEDEECVGSPSPHM